MVDLPSGTVTFLFTDIQGSTMLQEVDLPDVTVALRPPRRMARPPTPSS
jgi:class 3 adenylate cyclase